MRLLGLKNIVYNANGWKYLLFYDVDGHRETPDAIGATLAKYIKSTTLTYGTKHGYHIIGLSPLTPIEWASAFSTLQHYFPSFYSGQTIRLSRKEGETQTFGELIDRGNVIPQLWHLYARRFGISYRPSNFNGDMYRLVFETYKSRKE